MPINVLVLGKGFISDHLNYKKYTNHIPSNELEIEKIIDEHKPDVIVNCIGRTGSPNIDWCETNKEITASTNTALPIMLAEACAKKSIHMIQIGSGCIYFGESPNLKKTGKKIWSGSVAHDKKIDTGWKEDDFANPKSFYSKSKYATDLILGSMSHITTLRIRMPVSSMNSPRNLLNKITGYSKVVEEPNSITFMNDLVNAVDWTIKNNKTGTYHITNPKLLTHSVFLEEYKKYIPEHSYTKISKEELDNIVIATRSNCILDSSKIINEGFEFIDVNTNIQNYVKQFVENKKL